MPTRFMIIIAFVLSSLISAPVLHADEPVELTITPRAVEQPLLKYRLLPAEFELKDGNAAPVLLRMIWDQKPYITSIYGTGKVDEALRLPLDDPQLIETGSLAFDTFYQYLKQAAYLRSADWEYPIGEEPLAYIRLPDAGGAREMVGKGLSVWIRLHIAKSDFDKAREGIGIGLAVSRHIAQTPFVIIRLLTNTIDRMMLDRVQELIVQPEAPNLYWSLTTLPQPLHDNHSFIEFEERMYGLTLVGLDRLNSDGPGDLDALRKIRPDELDHLDAPRSPEEWETLFHATLFVYAEDGTSQRLKKTEVEQLRQQIITKAHTELSGKLPGAAGSIEKMSDAEVAVRWLAARHRGLSQEITALMSLSPRDAIPRLKQLQAKIKKMDQEDGLITLFNLYSPLNVYVILHRNERRIAMLRIIEGLRHYAATHDGRLPAALADLTDTPAPEDPLLEQPFEYTLTDGVATLFARGIDVGEAKLAECRYRIKVRTP